MGDGTFAETGRLPGRERLPRRDVCRDGTFAETGCLPGRERLPGSRHACISLIFFTFRLYGKNVFWDVFRPIPAKWDPGKAGQYL